MKKVYISPSLRTINVQIGNVIAAGSGGGGRDMDGECPGMTVTGEGKPGVTAARFFDGGYGCADEELDW